MSAVESNMDIKPDQKNALSIVQECLLEKANALRVLTSKLGLEVEAAIDLIIECKGRVIISGMGKSGIIGKKIAATLSSTGTSSFFVHPGEAYHGDLGMIRGEDVLLLISNSGETDEVIKLIPSLKSFGNSIICIVNNPDSTLAKNSDVVLDIFVEKEVCPNNLAPTTSTTLTLALADSLAVALMRKRNFQPEQFAIYHPGGSLGKRLLTKVKDEMVSKNLPFVSPDALFDDVILKMTQSKLGMAIVMDGDTLKGVVSDGDLRRCLIEKKGVDGVTAKDLMTTSPIIVNEEQMLSDAEVVMRENHVQWVLVEAVTNIVGVLEIYK
jgi:arabinose-5-phosphate isomerase